ncbi:AfsR/SARP family transcriptional regulator [Luteipulveratus mongoliensis]|uniref:AfsR/SARP family transcriptional regulator n=1 Tax=Luteipulveratus mongoliensis TaxID=571913 RepID=UPI0014705E22|nr:BTAD domain-containing putative transcriptional regulator [Luteipulveratus mongoliensis]
MFFGALGPLEIRYDTGRTVPLAPGKQTVLLATLLAGNGARISADQVIDALWGEQPPRSARSSMHVHIHRLRLLLGEDGKDRVEHASDGYRLVLDEDDFDVREFECLVQDGRPSDALALWRGEPYAAVGASTPVERERVRLSALHVEVTERSVASQLAGGRYEDLTPVLVQLVTDHPLHEGFWAHLVTCHRLAGRTDEALAAYAEARRVLSTELGLEPGLQLQQALSAVLSTERAEPAEDTQTLHRQVPAELPPVVTLFTGRQEQLAVVQRELRDQSASSVGVVALYGPGGVGKSAIAAHAARAVAADFPDGQIYLHLRGATPGAHPVEPAAAVARLLRSLGLADGDIPPNLEEASARLRSMTADRKLLLVLDDVSDVAQVRPLLPGGGGSAVLVTSRSMLASLDGTAHHQVGVLDRDEAIELLLTRAGLVPSPDERAVAAEVAHLCDDLPLAICIAAAKLRQRRWDLRTLANRLHDQGRRLDVLAQDDRAVRMSFALSYDGIDADAGRLLGAMSLLDGSDIGLSAAAAAAALGEPETSDLLDTLCDAQLVQVSRPDRFAMHDLVRLCGRELVTSESARQAAVHRVAEHYLATAVGASAVGDRITWRTDGLAVEAPAVELTSEAEVSVWLSSDMDNVLVTAQQVSSAGAEGARLSRELAAAMFAPLNSRGQWREIEKLNDVALQACSPDVSGYDRALLHNDLAWALSLLGSIDASLEHVGEAIRLWAEAGSIRGRAVALRVRSSALSHLDRTSESLESAQEAARLFATLGDRHGELDSMVAIGLLHSRNGRLEQAAEIYVEALTLTESGDFRWQRAIVLGNIADLRRRLGRTTDAVMSFERALEADAAADLIGSYYEAEHRWGLATSMHELGGTDRARVEWRQAAEQLHQLGLIGAEELHSIEQAAVPTTPSIILRQL